MLSGTSRNIPWRFDNTRLFVGQCEWFGCTLYGTRHQTITINHIVVFGACLFPFQMILFVCVLKKDIAFETLDVDYEEFLYQEWQYLHRIEGQSYQICLKTDAVIPDEVYGTAYILTSNNDILPVVVPIMVPNVCSYFDAFGRPIDEFPGMVRQNAMVFDEPFDDTSDDVFSPPAFDTDATTAHKQHIQDVQAMLSQANSLLSKDLENHDNVNIEDLVKIAQAQSDNGDSSSSGSSFTISSDSSEDRPQTARYQSPIINYQQPQQSSEKLLERRNAIHNFGTDEAWIQEATKTSMLLARVCSFDMLRFDDLVLRIVELKYSA